MLGNRPHDSRLRFGLALEYLKAGRTEEGVREDAADRHGHPTMADEFREIVGDWPS
jgi:hypothetical protein